MNEDSRAPRTTIQDDDDEGEGEDEDELEQDAIREQMMVPPSLDP